MKKIHLPFAGKSASLISFVKLGTRLLLSVIILLQASFVHSQSSDLITNISATTGRSYILGELITGTTIYSDRAYQATSVPALLNNAPLIKTPNDDKANKGTSILSFTLTQNATVYIAYDPRGTTLPAWLSSWQKLTSRVGVNDPKISYMVLFSKSYPAGTVTLDGNLASPAAGALNNYFVMAVQATADQYTLTATASGNGTVTKNPDQASYANGASVTLTATPAAGYEFTGWSGSASGTVNPLSVTMNGNKSITANFAPVNSDYTLTATASGNGTVTKNPNQTSYTSGSAVTLTATAVSGHQFTGWSGDATGSTNPLTVTMNSNKSITANFAAITPGQSIITLTPAADAFVRDGSYANTNYGIDTALLVKAYTTSGITRVTYLKFPLNVSKVRSAKLRLYGRNTESTAGITVTAFGVNDDSWTERGITFANAPAPALSNKLSSVSINDKAKYYELDVTDFVKFKAGDASFVSFIIKDQGNGNKTISFNSREYAQNRPQLVIDTTTSSLSNALLFIENPDKFPSNQDFVFSRVQLPWTRDSIYNANHDSIKVKIRNKGINPLIISAFALSNDTTWKIEKLNGVTYVPGSSLPVTVNAGAFIEVTLRFIAMDQAVRVKVLHETFTITSNDDNYPVKTVYLHGIWQRKGEGGREPQAQEILNAFGYTTKVGFNFTDPDTGDSTKLKGDEIKPSYFIRADTSRPISIRQLAAYHGCCHSTEKLQWYPKGTTTLTTAVSHIALDGQSLLPRGGTSGSPAAGSISPSGPFGFRIGSNDWTDATKTPQNKIGVRVWKAFDANGNIIPNALLISNDYLGSSATNYDYNDNTYFISNIRPEVGTAYSSTLSATPSALDFGSKVLQANNSLQLNIKNLGQTHANGSADPSITISSIDIVGENRFEFSASIPAGTTLSPQQTTAITVNFKPISQGLKIADLLIYYKNSLSPLRVPLYGIGKASDTEVVVNYRIKSGSATSMTINGKTWVSDAPYAFNNLEPYANPKVSQIAATDEDDLYFIEQSSDGDKRPFKYEIPVENGKYVVRLHFAEVYWGVPGTSTGLAGGAGSRVMSVKIENELRLVNFDIVQEVGGASAVIKNLPVTVTDGKITIDFTATVNRPSVSAVEVYSFVPSLQRPAVSSVTLLPTETSTENLSVSPNPVHNTFNIQFPGTSYGNTSIQIVDLFGRIYQVSKTNLQGSRPILKVDISRFSLNSGMYFLKVVSEGRKTEVIKLIVQ